MLAMNNWYLLCFIIQTCDFTDVHLINPIFIVYMRIHSYAKEMFYFFYTMLGSYQFTQRCYRSCRCTVVSSEFVHRLCIKTGGWKIPYKKCFLAAATFTLALALLTSHHCLLALIKILSSSLFVLCSWLISCLSTKVSQRSAAF